MYDEACSELNSYLEAERADLSTAESLLRRPSCAATGTCSRFCGGSLSLAKRKLTSTSVASTMQSPVVHC
ncbi:hypothetical protein HYH03_007961 [Edaphochlamys debaryana]|uniref:Uncharacterized protein n=1 Tax=Edaphochlamys debaryana TaxID=47281 RepID=A0A836BZT8_9CHLO|nr:hypothetical protein HYH03_007961 [Edaphochlamys debaryana]|eukprot:KAG2493738.1 hypothetical protein HYH03_007961 [Edaphochlamys debaryana]